ncbi:hypothetical protein [Palleronia aestuarii]|uniref:hypothetical protein n=1 Tax=Palleronia aestuarii TaxID=568105 RepID=UPI001474E80D|nr:hypothetical protein [Palleronia aestuarii]
MRWSRTGRLETVDLGTRDATPWLREEALKLHPELWHAVIAVEAKRGRGEVQWS